MKVIEDLNTWRSLRRLHVDESFGFVPTMGALHEGHLSLIRQSVNDNQRTVVSIYVNPTQFNNPDDLKTYPVTLSEDLEKCQKLGVDYVLNPTYRQLYPLDYRFKVTESTLSQRFCGRHRPGHFDGVLTVVLKFLNLVDAERAYFGEKDFQQLQLIKDMAEAFFLPTEIIAGPTLRESDGLAMSSRNLKLSESQRKLAPQFYQVLKDSMSNQEATNRLNQLGFEVDYVESFEDDQTRRRLAAVTLGSGEEKVRLIDNVSQ